MRTVFGSGWLFNSLLPLIMVWHCFCGIIFLHFLFRVKCGGWD